jgi:hypothetical protein
MKRLMLIIVILLLATGSGLAQETDGKVVVQTFKLKFKSAERAASVISSLVSSEGSVSIQPGSNVVIVTDRAGNLEKIESIIADYDMPSRELELEIRLVGAGRVAGKPPEVPAGLEDIAGKLSGVLRFNSFEKLGALELTGREGDSIRRDIDSVYHAEFVVGEFDPVSETIQLSGFKLSRYETTPESDKRSRNEILETTLNLKIGQTVILGASRLPDSNRALMLIVVARQ